MENFSDSLAWAWEELQDALAQLDDSPEHQEVIENATKFYEQVQEELGVLAYKLEDLKDEEDEE